MIIKSIAAGFFTLALLSVLGAYIVASDTFYTFGWIEIFNYGMYPLGLAAIYFLISSMNPGRAVKVTSSLHLPTATLSQVCTFMTLYLFGKPDFYGLNRTQLDFIRNTGSALHILATFLLIIGIYFVWKANRGKGSS